MKLIILMMCLLNFAVYAQENYEPTDDFPFGQPNPEAPEQIKDFQPMIGLCNCKSINRNPDGTWKDAVEMTWKFKYILNGMAIQDQTLKNDGGHSGSIRQFNSDSSRWYVHWYSSKSPSTVLPVWEGNKEGDKIILYRKQKAPNGMEGFYRLTFYDMTESGYKWIGEWVNPDETIQYPTWKIECVKAKD